ncbi:MAG: hypothetical protein VYA99_09390 [Pseudomonadota bacterium]|nr:hypothetical protein [Pseudomonadota bacterium]
MQTLVVLKLLNNNWLTLFLALVLLSNSSLALEILTHDSHQHLEVANAHDGHEMRSSEMEMQLYTSGQNTSYHQYQHDEEGCVCDEICCLSSVDIGTYSLENQRISKEPDHSAVSCHYRSIIPDLFLPPPTR